MQGLSPQQVAHFQSEGYLVIKGLFDPAADLDPVIAEYAGVLDRLVNILFESGEISSRYEELSFSQKLIKIQQEKGGLPDNMPNNQQLRYEMPDAAIR